MASLRNNKWLPYTSPAVHNPACGNIVLGQQIGYGEMEIRYSSTCHRHQDQNFSFFVSSQQAIEHAQSADKDRVIFNNERKRRERCKENSITRLLEEPHTIIIVTQVWSTSNLGTN